MKMKKLAFSILAASPLFFLNTAHASESPKEASSSTTTLNNELLKNCLSAIRNRLTMHPKDL